MKHWFYIAFTGVLWIFMGLYLSVKGIDFLSISNLSPFYFISICIVSIVVGFLKEKFILKKTVKRIVGRILSFMTPIPVLKIYDRRFYMIIFMMVALAQSLKLFSFPVIIRGGIDLAIGVALIKGGYSFINMGISSKKISY